MAVPKKKTSKMRSRTRRTHYKCVAPNVTLDKQTGLYVMSHKVCPSTGRYNGKVVVATEVAG